MSRYSGRQGEGARRSVRERKREERNKKTVPERRRQYRRVITAVEEVLK